MKEEQKQALGHWVQDFRLPRFQEIPDVGLYLEQVTKYLSGYLSPVGEVTLTPSMITNYVKKDLITNPVKKQYSRDQIAHLMFIALAKSVLSLEDLREFIRLQERTYTTQRAYDYFCDELENMLLFVFGLTETVENIGEDSSDEKTMLRNCIIAVTNKIYLEKYIRAVAAECLADN